ncbi:MAG: formylglycine-generating enzyme family protein [Isosphaeraceae bacterium]
MALTFKMVASEILMCGLKSVPVAGKAVEVVDAIQSRHEKALMAERLEEVHVKLTRVEERQRALIAEEIQTFLSTLRRPDLGGQELDEELRNFRQIQEQGWNPGLFEGIFLNSTHLAKLKEKPQIYGKVLGDHEVIDTSQEMIHILMDTADQKTRVLELSPAAFSHVLTHQPRGVPEARLQLGEGVWAYPEAGQGIVTPAGSARKSAAATNTVGMTLVAIAPGEFTMGSEENDDEKPPHRVRITKPFLLAAHPVTQGQYRAVTGQNPSHFKGSDDFPVESVSWHDAVAFCNTLSEKEKRTPCYGINGTTVIRIPGNGYRLPTEAEWEYACRAGTSTRFFFGDDESELCEYAWYDGNASGQTQPVGHRKPNGWGLYDMLGNVWEWCWDWYDDKYYAKSPRDDPAGPSSASHLVIRGGSWRYEPTFCRPASRGRFEPVLRAGILGFRVATVQAG